MAQASEERTLAGRARPPLSRQRVLRTALRLVDEHGLDSLSMRRLGAELGVEAMSLYNHVDGKEAIVEGLVELVMSEIEIPGAEVTDWKERARIMSLSFMRAARAHPHVFPLIQRNAACTPEVIRPVEEALRTFESIGVGGEDGVKAYRTFVSFMFGFLSEHLTGLLSDQAAERFDHEALKSLPPDEFRLFHEAVPTIGTADLEEEYRFGIEMILAGLEGYFRSREPKASPPRRSSDENRR